jgi:CubicO group peptidase (beta-lactamase class C family)
MRSYRNSDPVPPIMLGSPPPPDRRVPLIDWDRPPWNRWSFQHVSELVPTAQILAGVAPSAMPSASGDLDDFRYAGPGGETTFADMLDATYTDAILVWKNGRVLHESFHNGMTPRRLHLLQSVSKSVTSAAAGCLISDGLLDPEAPVTTFLPELAATAWKGATLQHVLDMTSGTRFGEEYTERDSDVGIMDYTSGWKPAPEGFDVSSWPTCIWEQILGLKVAEAEHGSRFRYRSIETDVLAHCMMRVSGKPLQDILSERIWQPMGAAEDATITVDRAGYGLACGGISASLRDMARFGLMMLNGGKVDGRQVVPEAWCRDIRHGSHGLYDPENYKEWPNGAYRNQFWVEDSRLGRHYCFGVFGQMIMIAPDTGFMAVKLSTWPDFVDAALYQQTITGLRAVERAFA